MHRICVLVDRRPVEVREPVRIVWKMPGHPVEQHANSPGVQGVHQLREVRWRAEAASRREQAGRLVAPGAVEGMLHYWQQFDMGESHIGSIGWQLLGQFAVGEPVFTMLAFLAP